MKYPYCLRVSDEVKIYDKLLFNSSLAKAHCAPDTLKMLAQFTVLSRLKEPENSNIYSKMRVYDGENLKDTDPKAKSIQEYRDSAGVDEGMFNFWSMECSAHYGKFFCSLQSANVG